MGTADQNPTGRLVVAKIGTSSITDEQGVVDEVAIAKFCAEVASARAAGHRVVAVTSGAIAAGLPALGLGGDRRPSDPVTLQAVSAIGQSRLMRVYDEAFAAHGLVAGQLLLAPLDFGVRSQYLHARSTILRLLDLGVVPLINENDAIADDEIRFGDNDRLAALVAHLVGADLLVLLTDAPGLLTADPRLDAEASLIEEIVELGRDYAAGALSTYVVPSEDGPHRKYYGINTEGRALLARQKATWSQFSATVSELVGTAVAPTLAPNQTRAIGAK